MFILLPLGYDVRSLNLTSSFHCPGTKNFLRTQFVRVRYRNVSPLEGGVSQRTLPDLLFSSLAARVNMFVESY